MQHSLFITICFLFYANLCDAQNRKVIVKAEAGISLSVGKEEAKEFQSSTNPLTVHYFENKHYKYPGFRMRFAIMKPLSSNLSLGLRSGADVHYFESNPYGYKETYFSFPIQGTAEIALFTFNSKSLFLLLGAGHKFRKADYKPYYYKGGMLLSMELSFGKSEKESAIYYKIGFNYTRENERYDYVPFNFGQNEIILLKVHRKNAFLALGVNF
jgi:hypothetical protein